MNNGELIKKLEQVSCGTMGFAKWVQSNDDIDIPFGAFIYLSGAGNILEGVIHELKSEERKHRMCTKMGRAIRNYIREYLQETTQS